MEVLVRVCTAGAGPTRQRRHRLSAVASEELGEKKAYELTVLLEFRRVLFRFQAEDGIRDHCVTGVKTCALPIYTLSLHGALLLEIGRRHVRSPVNQCSRMSSSALNRKSVV